MKKNTVSGKKFEELTNNEENLLVFGFRKITKKNFVYYKLDLSDQDIIYCKNNNFKTYIKEKYNLLMVRFPDEAYIIETKL